MIAYLEMLEDVANFGNWKGVLERFMEMQEAVCVMEK